MIEEDVLVAIDTFNRFRRPDIEAKLLGIEKSKVTIEFAGEAMSDYYLNYFREKLETCAGVVHVESVEKDGKRRAVFSIKSFKEEEGDPLQKALKILGKYNEGVSSIKFGIED